MADTRGTWSLSEAWAEKSAAEWVPIPNVWIPNNNFGHGSYLPGNIIRYNTSNSTVTNTDNTSNGTNDGPGGGSQTHTYWSGGGGNFSTIRKLTYSTYTYESNLPIYVLTPAREQMGTVSKETDLYYTGSSYPSLGIQSSTQKLTFSNDSIALVPGSPYPVAQAEQASFTGGGLYGYFWSGVNSPVNSKLTRLTFSNDTFTIIPASVSPTTYRNGWNLGNTTKGYVVGGIVPWVSTTRKLTYSDETYVTVPGANYPRATGTGVAFTAGEDTGLYSAGKNPSSNYTNTHLLTFSTDSWALDSAMNNTGAPGPSYDYGTGKGTSARDSRLGGASNFTEDGSVRWFDSAAASPNFGYSATGRGSSNWAPGPAMEFTYKVDYGTDTSSNSPTAKVGYGLEQAFGAGNSTTAYKMGGRSNDEPSDGSERGEKIVYATDTRASTPNYGNRRYGSFMVTNGTTNLIATAGRGQPSNQLKSNSYKMAYSSESWSSIPAQPSGPSANVTSSARKAGATLATSTHGYFAGGGNGQPSVYSNVDKFDFSNDTQARVPGANLTNSVDGNRGFSRGDAGYSMGGLTNGGDYLSSIDKITFSTDTTAAFPSNLPDGVQSNQTMSSDSAGYATGGQGPSPSGWDRSTVSKMSFSTGTFSASGNLPTYQHHGIGMSAGSDNLPFTVSPTATPTATSGPWQYQLSPGVPNHGYYLGGSGNHDTGSTNSMKFSFATDTFDNSVRLTNRFTTSANGKMASSPSHAYCVYGQGNPAPGGDTGVSWVRKVQYSNDTGSNAPNAVDQPSHKAAVAGSMTNMYVAGGQDSHGVPLGTRTNVRKLTYSNDTWTTISQSNANYSNPSGWPRANFASGGTQTYALWGWGSPNNYRTSISKYTYATDTGVFSIPGVTADYSQGSGQVGNSNSTHWWLARGNTSNGGPFQSKISRWTFATDTAQFPTTLTDEWYDYSDANGTGAINDGMTAGYWCGGHQDQSDSTSTLKISYATETASRGTDIPAGRTPGANGAFNGYAGTSVREFGAETTLMPNLI